MDIASLLQQNTNAFTITFAHDILAETTWAFPRHHLIYATQGCLMLEVEDAIWQLPPSQAAWIPANVQATAASYHAINCLSIFFHDDFFESEDFLCRVFPVSTLAREMILYSQRWAENVPHPESLVADQFYASLAYVCRDLYQEIGIQYLPKAKSPELNELLHYILENLAENLTLAEASTVFNLSKRTIARRFSEELHLSWSQYLYRARMIKAFELLAGGHNVTETALAVGFKSMSAFSTAFRKFANLSPKEYRDLFL